MYYFGIFVHSGDDKLTNYVKYILSILDNVIAIYGTNSEFFGNDQIF